jgi:hypothetical protein
MDAPSDGLCARRNETQMRTGTYLLSLQGFYFCIFLYCSAMLCALLRGGAWRIQRFIYLGQQYPTAYEDIGHYLKVYCFYSCSIAEDRHGIVPSLYRLKVVGWYCVCHTPTVFN